MKFEPHGKHLIAGKWVAGTATFASEPAHGPSHQYAVGTPDLVDAAGKAAEAAFWSYGFTSRKDRAAFLNAIADEIELRGPAITEIGTQETGLPVARLEGELGRIELPAGLFHGGRRHGFCPSSRLPGCRERPQRASGHGRDHCRSDSRGNFALRRPPRCLFADSGWQA